MAEQAWETTVTEDATLVVKGDTDLLADSILLTNVFENLFRNTIEHVSADVTVTVGTLDTEFCIEVQIYPPDVSAEAVGFGQ